MSKWNELSMKEKSEMMKIAVQNGITNLSDIKQRYNEFAMGGDTEEEEILNKVNNSTANFVQRLKDSNRKSIPDWETNGRKIATHKLSVGTDREGNNYIYPEVQEINGKLVDFTRPPYAWYAGMDSAEERGDTVRVPNLDNAIKFTETYKQYYPKGNTFDGESQKSQKMSKRSWKQRHQAQWYGFLRNKGVSDADAQRLSGFFTAQDGLESAGGTSKAATEKNNYGGMQRGGKNIAYDSINDYMEDRWRMMNNRFKPALSARTIDEYATILGNPDTAGHGYLYYVTDKVPYNPNSAQWRAAQTQHMHNYINGMRAWDGKKTINFKNNPVVYAQLPERLSESTTEVPAFMPSNPEAFFAPLSIYERSAAQEESTQPLVEVAQTYSDEELKRQERQEGLKRFNMLLNILNRPDTKQKEDNYFGNVLGLMMNKPDVSSSNTLGLLGLMGNKYDGESMPTQKMQIQLPIYYNVPDATRVVEKPITFEPIDRMEWEEAALGRAKVGNVYNNYDEAKDEPLSWPNKVFRNTLRFLQDRGLNPFGSGVSNCTLTTTQWVDPLNPIKKGESIIKNPEKYNYTSIDSAETVPGNILIARNPNDNTHHTMLITGFAGQDSIVNFDGKKYNVKKGEPLLTYSRGGHDKSFLRRNIPISAYTPNSDGKTENHFFRYNYPNEVFLPEITISGKKKK